MQIKWDEVDFYTLYNADPVGQMFVWQNRYFRRIDKKYTDFVKELFACGLIDELIAEKVLVNSWISDLEFEGNYLVVEHERIANSPNVTQWTYNMLKDAAITTLKMNQICKKYAYEIKDAHTANILFQNDYPLFCDLGSICKNMTYGKNWKSKDQFIIEFYYPLLLQSRGCTYLSKCISSVWQDRRSEEIIKTVFPYIPMWIIERYLSIKSKISDIERKVRTFSRDDVKNINLFKILVLKFVTIFRMNEINGVKSLREGARDCEQWIGRINKLQCKNETYWGRYQENYSIQKGNRFDILEKELSKLSINSSIEVGANMGVFSRYLLEQGTVKRAIITDYDANAIDRAYLDLKRNPINALPMLLDIANADDNTLLSLKSDVVIALALTHHLILSQKIRFDKLVDKFSLLTRNYILIEFMPLGLWYEGCDLTMLKVPEWYTEEWFIGELERKFDIIYKKEVSTNRVAIIGALKEESNERVSDMQ